MQSSKKLTNALRKLIALVEEEAARNPLFAERLEDVVASLPPGQTQPKTVRRSAQPALPPDVFAAFQEKGAEEFRYWLKSLNINVLKAIVKTNGFDPGKTAQRWTDPDKFTMLIADQTAARLRRGSSFLGPKSQGGSGT